jgi:hypothetical protein
VLLPYQNRAADRQPLPAKLDVCTILIRRCRQVLCLRQVRILVVISLLNPISVLITLFDYCFYEMLPFYEVGNLGIIPAESSAIK